MSIVERNGNFYAVVYPDGKAKWIACGKSKRKAQALHDEYMVKARRGELHIPKPILLRDFARLFIEDYCDVALKPVTTSMYQSHLNRHLIPEFGRYRMTSIRPEMVQRYVSRLVRESRLSPKSVRNIIVPMRRMFTLAQQWGYANSNPVRGIALPRVERNEVAFLTPRQIRLLIDHTPDEWKALVALGCLCGLRKGEVLGLTWDCVLWNEHRIWVRQSLWNGRLQEPKTRSSQAKVPLPPVMETMLLERMTLSPVSEMNLVFCQDDGSPLKADWVNRILLARALNSASLPRVTFHGLRHSFVAAHIASGTPVTVIQGLCRHSSFLTTIDKYGHLLPESRDQAALSLEAAVWSAE